MRLRPGLAWPFPAVSNRLPLRSDGLRGELGRPGDSGQPAPQHTHDHGFGLAGGAAPAVGDRPDSHDHKVLAAINCLHELGCDTGA